MQTFVMVTRIQPDGLASGRSLHHLEERTMGHIRRECPEVEWAPDIETATRVATLVHIHGHATTETWGAVPWRRFKELLDAMPPELVSGVAE